MSHWNTRGLRGSTFEEMINMTNDAYSQKGLAVIQKIPTPITPVQIDNTNHTISLAYFDSKSTVDYIGAVQGIPVCFDAKETARKSLPIQNIHSHQIEFMESFERQKGLSFLLVHFQTYDEIYYLPFATLKKYWEASRADGRKSIPYDSFDKKLIVVSRGGFLIHYLEAIDWFLRSVGE